MAGVREVAQEMAGLWPKIMRGVHAPSVFRLRLSSAQMLVLATLRELGECKVTTLAKEKGVSLPTITGLLDRLVKAGFVQRRREALASDEVRATPTLAAVAGVHNQHRLGGTGGRGIAEGPHRHRPGIEDLQIRLHIGAEQHPLATGG